MYVILCILQYKIYFRWEILRNMCLFKILGFVALLANTKKYG